MLVVAVQVNAEAKLKLQWAHHVYKTLHRGERIITIMKTEKYPQIEGRILVRGDRTQLA